MARAHLSHRNQPRLWVGLSFGLLCLLAIAVSLPAQDVPSRCRQPPPSAFINDVGTVFLDIITLGQAKGFGYDLINPDGHLFGITRRERPAIASDGDWNVFVEPLNPLPGFQSNVGLTSAEDLKVGAVECEICNKCMDLLRGRLPITNDWVQFDGMHVLDNSHGGKTEIHPAVSMRLVEGGPSRPNPNEEVFRLAIGAGGTCPDYSFARVATPSAQATTTSVQLFWPPPLASSTPGLTSVPAFEITKVWEGTSTDNQSFTPVQIWSFTPVIGSLSGSFDGNPFSVSRAGSSVEMNAGLLVTSGSFETRGKIYDIRTFWVPLQVHIVVDAVLDRGILRNRQPFPVRSYQIRAHGEIGTDPRARELFPVGQLQWFLHRNNTGYSTPAPLLIGSGQSVDFIHDLAPSRGLSNYDLRLELRAPNGLSVSAPISLSRPRVSIAEVARTEACVTTPGNEKARRISVTLEAHSTNFFSGPNLRWTITPYPLPVNAPPVVTATGARVSHDFSISKSSPVNYFKVSLEGVDLDGVESAGDEEFLNFVPVVQILCRPKPGQVGTSVLSVETLGMPCGVLQYKWHTGQTTSTIEIPTATESTLAEVTVTDASGQSVRLRSNVCGRAGDEVRRMQLFERMDAIRALMRSYGLLPLVEPSGPDPGPEPYGPFADIMKRWVLSANSAPPSAVDQRAALLGRILERVTGATEAQRVEVLKAQVTDAVRSVRSGSYRETMKAEIRVPQTAWQKETFERAKLLAGEVFSRR
jgi:hypothetical protein